MAKSFFALLALLSFYVYAQPEDDITTKTGQVVTEKNESICKTTFSREMFNQQMTFSDQDNDKKVRRIAERKIAAAREAFAETGSYCDAADVLLTFEPKSLSSKDGDAQFRE
ncbi:MULTISPECIES: hypothetical protein [Salinivibrio]|uniref:Uncharacterized protein n=1 Tax=Salinivibrio costicola TaxID=51367 RepID=A0ABX6KBK8_SALCS|nr:MULTISPECIES: hypothetical protein [Salinivibrio]OOF21091.1 hypothetical protein BZJ17_10325 [Salinivibrio sp. IB574]QIR07880.1 hypothetical protein HBA18_15965 [Salinivibrio costicola]